MHVGTRNALSDLRNLASLNNASKDFFLLMRNRFMLICYLNVGGVLQKKFNTIVVSALNEPKSLSHIINLLFLFYFKLLSLSSVKSSKYVFIKF